MKELKLKGYEILLANGDAVRCAVNPNVNCVANCAWFFKTEGEPNEEIVVCGKDNYIGVIK